jgi:hypothetical protein
MTGSGFSLVLLKLVYEEDSYTVFDEPLRPQWFYLFLMHINIC